MSGTSEPIGTPAGFLGYVLALIMASSALEWALR